MTTQRAPWAAADDAPIRIGVSHCLLGANVRFDGGHKKDPFLTGTFARFVEWVPVCPEVEVGMGTPRETLRLVRRGDVRLVTLKTGIDHTDSMRAWARRRAGELAHQDLSGYVLKKDSPSCGMERVKVYDGNGVPAKDGRGLFAQALLERLPNLPVEEEGRLGDALIRDTFVERVFAYRRLRSLLAGRFSVGDLVAFHTAHKLQLMAHSPRGYAELGRLVAEARTLSRAELRQRYEQGFMDAMRVPATARRHVNVLEHMLGYFKKRLPDADRLELRSVIAEYHKGLVPLIVPLTLLRHHVRREDVEYLRGQVYLEPHPRELMLRNHV